MNMIQDFRDVPCAKNAVRFQKLPKINDIEPILDEGKNEGYFGYQIPLSSTLSAGLTFVVKFYQKKRYPFCVEVYDPKSWGLYCRTVSQHEKERYAKNALTHAVRQEMKECDRKNPTMTTCPFGVKNCEDYKNDCKKCK